MTWIMKMNEKDIPTTKVSEMGTPQQQHHQPTQRPHNQQQQQQYCLRWNNHRSNLLSVFDELLQNEAFTDVMLACEGGNVRCHRMVLAACSQYFQSLLTDLPCKHPVIVLKDVRLEEMRAILEYMYRGEVNVAQDQLAGLLRVAESLKVKGLVEEKGAGPPQAAPEQEPMEQGRSLPSPPSPPHISTSSQSNPVHSSNSGGSPPHFKSSNPYIYKTVSSAPPNTTARPMPVWPHMPLPPSHSPQCYDAADMSPLRRKKLSSLLMHNRDTPILRTVLGQGQPDSPQQPVSLVCRTDSRDSIINGSEVDQLHLKHEPSEDAQSPYTDASEESNREVKLGVPSSSPQAFSNIANYVPAQRPEWKRYKQYTRDDIMSAIDAVRNGMSALQAARKYKVPSRTLYDKVKKLGITTSRPFKRGANGSTSVFPYAHWEQELPDGALNNNSQASTFLEATLLQHALDNTSEEKRDALVAIAAAAAAANALHHPPPSPKYHQTPEGSPGPGGGGGHSSENEDHVEDLSVQRHQVIVPNPEKMEAEAD